MSRIIFTALICSLAILSSSCKPPSQGGDPNRGPENGPPSQPNPSPPPAIVVPNLRTGLTPDPPEVKAGPEAFAAQKPAERPVPNGPLIGDFDSLDKIPLAYITFKGTNEWCSGVLVSDETADAYIVVTAAHCFWDSAKKFYEPKDVFLLTKTGGWAKADTVFYERSDIDDAEYKDIALIRLKNKPAINTFPPIPIAGRAFSPAPNAQKEWEEKELLAATEVYSWGYTSRKWTKRSTITMTGGKIWGDAAGRDMRQWVIPTKYQVSYGGDSGGPLVAKIGLQWHLLGVLQGYKPDGLYTDEQTITFTWVDSFMQNIWDANGTIVSTGMALPIPLDAAKLKKYNP